MISALLSFIFPRNCVGCGEAIDRKGSPREWEYLCGQCACELRSVGEEGCEHCGVPMYGVISGRRICSVCKEAPPTWGQARSLLRYTGPAKGWVKKYKFSDARWVEREWEKLLKASSYAWLKEFLRDTIIVPVPLHPLKKFLRGFNQSEEFTKLLLQTLKPEGAMMDTTLLRRVRWTRQQARLRRDDRLRNVKGAFESTGTPPKDKRIVIVDDLLTTGATLNVCAQALKKSGARNVDVLAICRG